MGLFVLVFFQNDFCRIVQVLKKLNKGVDSIGISMLISFLVLAIKSKHFFLYLSKLRKVKFKIKGQSHKPYAATPSVVQPFLLNSGSLLCIILSFIMESDEPQSAELSKYTGPVAGVKLLIVDADLARRAFISKFLLSLGYEILTATLASDALSIIGEKWNEINIVLVDVQLPDMEIYDLIQKMKENTNIPFPSFIRNAYDKSLISKALGTGAMLCLRTAGDLQQLMDVEGLPKETVSNYLQKYRQSMNLRASPVAQHLNGYVSITKKSRGKHPLSLKKKGATNNPAFNRKDLNKPLRAPVLGTSARFLTLESSSSQESPFSQNQLSPPWKQEVVEHSTSGLGRFLNCVNGDASEKIRQVINTADGKVSNAGQQLNFSTLMAFNMSNQFWPALPIALLPPEENEKIDEIFYTKESQIFTDEDLNMWLSTIPDNVNRDAIA
ncbi:uncharacterized protein LOC123898320 isoform X2 [Trifolium pratense]|uniref:uncharacterized protein LOC123898320 isoform X2 n=1 Tax=Trifolium pratense TaxID=57577 RepID=UPI001E6945D2|nr:uncharacterized protein LOC123898320 isoform X2 [Trifolium pratense]